MKDFIKMTLAAIVAIIITSVLFMVITVNFLSGLASLESSVPKIPASGVLRIDMSKFVLGEQSVDNYPFIAAYSGSDAQRTVGILDAVLAVRNAATDSRIKYIYLKTDGNVSGAAALKELRDALLYFRTMSGKAVISYIEAPTTGGYYLASVADKVYMAPYSGGNIMFNGVNAQAIFLKDLLDKMGVNVQLIRHGKYKSAGEMFTRSEASDENREQYERMVASMWENISAEIAGSRSISIGELDGAIDNLELCLPKDFVDKGLVDELLDRNALEGKLAAVALCDGYDDISFVDFADYLTVGIPQKSVRSGKKIAVIYADGEIIDGSSKDEVAGDRFASIIEKVRDDESVQAVVLRVNSPGGSVTASEKIKSELDRLKGEVPLVASYGGYAASGGYWISNNCDYIVTNPLCLTGSIGVFGLVPEFSGLCKDKLHVNVTTFSSNRHGDMYSLMRPFDTAEYNYVLKSIEDIYGRFTSIVAEARNLEVEEVDRIGQGRVWTGTDAIALSLADRAGGIYEALEYAAEQAGDPDLLDWEIAEYPKSMSEIEMIVDEITNPGGDDYSVLAGKLKECRSVQIQARLPFEIILQK